MKLSTTILNSTFLVHACFTLDQIGMIVRNLSAIGVHTYQRTISNTRINVVQVLAPMLERFFLVGDGAIIAPGTRGEQFL